MKAGFETPFIRTLCLHVIFLGHSVENLVHSKGKRKNKSTDGSERINIFDTLRIYYFIRIYG